MNFLRKLSCFHKQHPTEITHPYHDTLPYPKPVLKPSNGPRFPTSTSPEPATSQQNTPESSRATRVASQAPQIPPDLFTNPTVRVVASTPTSELEGDSPPSTGEGRKDAPKSPSSWLTTGSEESAVLGAQDESRRVLGEDLQSLPSVRVTMHEPEYHAK